MKPYALEWREKILQASLHKEGSLRSLAKRFQVSARFVGALVVRCRRTGRYAPKPHGGGHPPGINPAQHAIVRDFVQQSPDATLQELCDSLAYPCQAPPSTSSMQRVLDVLQLTRKKRPSTLQSVTPRRYNRTAVSSKQR